MKKRILALAVMMTLALPAALRAGTITYFDTEFTDWTYQIIQITGAFTDTPPVRVGTGGNGGAYREQTLSADRSAGGSTFAITVANFGGIFYDPSVSGAIDGLTIGYDLRGIAADIDIDFSGLFRPYLQQAGTIFSLGTTINDQATFGAWTSYLNSSTSADDWFEIGVSESDSAKPDFSENGSVIQFGYRVGLGMSCPANIGAFCRAASLTSGLDNFSVSITSFDDQAVVPEPATLALLGTGLVVVGLRRWQQRRTSNGGGQQHERG